MFRSFTRSERVTSPFGRKSHGAVAPRSRIRQTLNRVLWVLSLVYLVSGVILIDHFTPSYKMAEAVYWEAVNEPHEGREGVRHVIHNRVENPYWPNSIYGVVLEGVERGNNRDFTYIDHHQKWWLPDWFPISPLAHAFRNGLMDRWLTIRLETIWFTTGGRLMDHDETGGALFYIRHDWPKGWFGKEERAGRMKFSVRLGAHNFYTYCKRGWKDCAHALASPKPKRKNNSTRLKGSRHAVVRAYRYSQDKEYPSVQSAKMRDRLYRNGKLAKLSSDTYRLSNVSQPYVLPEVAVFVEQLAQQYARACGETLVVTSALRLTSAQRMLPNGSRHPFIPLGWQ